MNKYVALVFAVIPTVCSLHAASFLWNSAQNILGDTDVNTQGTLFEAANVGGANTTVNGVTFAAFTTSSTHFSLAGTNSTFNGYGSVNAPFSTLSAPYQSLLSTGNFGSGNSVMTLTISGLTINQSYLFQFWINDSRQAFVGQAVTATTGATSVTADADTIDLEGGRGQYATGTFVADATSQDVSFQGSASGGTLENAFQLRSVPEPASVALLVAGGALLFARRRKN